MPAELRILTDAYGIPMCEWTSEPLPGALGNWVRLIVVRAREWSPAVRIGSEEQVARLVARLDLEAALCSDRPAAAARAAMQGLIDGGAFLDGDPMTEEMLEALLGASPSP